MTTTEIQAPISHTRLPQALSTRLQRTGALIGQTPIHRFASIESRGGPRIYAKLEWLQAGGSVKARAAYHIIRHALEQGFLHQGNRLLDASSGNTGIAYGVIAASLGIPVTLCLPSNASYERKAILQSLGVEVILTDPLAGTDGAQEYAAELAAAAPDKYYYADQYKNNQNWLAHYHTTAREILHQTEGQVTHFTCGLGTTGSFVGNGRGLRLHNPRIHLLALQPDGPLHGMEGWKDLESALVPGIFDPTLADATLAVSTDEAYDMIRFVARHEGLLLSPSAAANLAGARRWAAAIRVGLVVTLLADNADKYSEVLQMINP
jgi:cysteine synthase B